MTQMTGTMSLANMPSGGAMAADQDEGHAPGEAREYSHISKIPPHPHDPNNSPWSNVTFRATMGAWTGVIEKKGERGKEGIVVKQTQQTTRKKTKLVKSKANFSLDELAGLLESMAKRIRAGDMTLGAGDAAVTMDMPTVFHTTMEVTDSRKRAGIERELELEITWTVDEDGNPVDKPGPVAGFAIS